MDRVIFIVARFNTERKISVLSTKPDGSVPGSQETLWALGWITLSETLSVHRWWSIRKKKMIKERQLNIAKIPEKKWTLSFRSARVFSVY